MGEKEKTRNETQSHPKGIIAAGILHLSSCSLYYCVVLLPNVGHFTQGSGTQKVHWFHDRSLSCSFLALGRVEQGIPLKLVVCYWCGELLLGVVIVIL